MRRFSLVPVVITIVAACAAPARAADETAAPAAAAERWTDAAEFSFVATGGNAETSALGFKNTLARAWDRSGFELKAGAVRARSAILTRTVVAAGPPPDVDESTATELTAENYFLNGRYDRKITDRLLWYSGAGWDRNRFAGIDNRYVAALGLGNIWRDSAVTKFRTDYAVTYTKQEDITAAPGVDDTFPGLRATSKFSHAFGQARQATFGNDTTLDENLEETSDFRADMTNWLAVAINSRLALKVSLQWLYDNAPAFEEADDPLGLLPPGTIALVELDSLDSIFTASMVVKF